MLDISRLVLPLFESPDEDNEKIPNNNENGANDNTPGNNERGVDDNKEESQATTIYF